MSRSLKTGLTIFICLIMFFSLVSGVYAQRTTFSEIKLKELEFGASRLTYKIDEEGNRFLSYLHGPLVTSIEPDGNNATASYVFRFSEIDIPEYDNGTINMAEIEVNAENVTDQLVFPYHYNYQIDSKGNIHTAFINDYTLYYAVRINGIWEETRLSNISRWWALQPDITLGENENPRIVYTVIYKSFASDFFGSSVKLSSRSAHYILFNGTDTSDPAQWVEYDVKDNHGAFADGPSKLLIYNPTIEVIDGKALIAFNEVRDLAKKSRMNFMVISEIPSVEAANQSFGEFTFTEIYSASVIATRFRRPSIFLIDQSVVIAYSSWQTGGAIISLLKDVNEKPDPDLVLQPLQWTNFELDRERRNLQIESISGILDPITDELRLTWSVFDLFNEGEGLFDFDVYSSIVTLDGGEFDSIVFNRVTSTEKIEHWYPGIAFNLDGEIEIAYVIHKSGEDNPYELAIGKIALLINTQKGGEWGFILSIAGLGILLGGWYLFVNKVVPPSVKEEEEVLPHMLNLKDSITKD